jgi:hypothetical protein
MNLVMVQYYVIAPVCFMQCFGYHPAATALPSFLFCRTRQKEADGACKKALLFWVGNG